MLPKDVSQHLGKAWQTLAHGAVRVGSSFRFGCAEVVATGTLCLVLSEATKAAAVALAFSEP